MPYSVVIAQQACSAEMPVVLKWLNQLLSQYPGPVLIILEEDRPTGILRVETNQVKMRNSF